MGKKDDIDQLTNLMSRSLRHKIGSIVNDDETYASKYANDAENIMREAEKVAYNYNWNDSDKEYIRNKLKKKLKKELKEKDFIDDKKFEIMDSEIDKALERFDL